MVDKLSETGPVWSLQDPKQNKRYLDQDARWNLRYKQLIESMCGNNGSCFVPNNYEKHPQLKNWVKKQRAEYRRLLAGKQSQITIERVHALNDIGFDWNVMSSRCIGTNWKDRYEELREYKAKYGDCHVPRTEYKRLAKWNEKQRTQYQYFIEGKKSQLTSKRIQLLNKLGFVWSYKSEISKKTWEEHFQELLKYRVTHGDCLVKSDTSTTLSKWAELQRKMYKRKLAGKQSPLSDEHVNKLNQIGFVWTLPKRARPAKAKKGKIKIKIEENSSDVKLEPLDLSIVKMESEDHSEPHPSFEQDRNDTPNDCITFEKTTTSIKQEDSEDSPVGYKPLDNVFSRVRQEIIGAADSSTVRTDHKEITDAPRDSDREFRYKIKGLRDFQRDTGLLYPPKDSPLSHWLERQREYFASSNVQQVSTLDHDRMMKLNLLGLL